MERDFDSAYNALPPKMRSEIRNKANKDIFLVDNPQTFYMKKNGKAKITNYEWNELTILFESYGVEIETGQLVCKTQQE